MSNLKIVKGGIQNSILKDGLFVFGEIDCLDTSSGRIYSSAYGAFAHGFVMGDAEIVASGIGSHAEGGAYADSSNKYSEILIASGNYSHAEGYSTTALGDWSHAEGHGMNGYRWVYQGGAPEPELYVITIQLLDLDENSNSSTYDDKIIICPGEMQGKTPIPVNSSIYYYDDDYETYKYVATVEECFPIEDVYDSSWAGYYVILTNNDVHLMLDILEYPHYLSYVTPETFNQYMRLIHNVTGAFGTGSHVEGYNTIASGSYSHAEGGYTEALVQYSHSEGYNTIANTSYGLVCGKYNDPSTTGLFVVGDGKYDDQRQNALTVNEHNIKGNVNALHNVYMGCPIGTMAMWLGVGIWQSYNLPVLIGVDDSKNPGRIPEGWILARGGTVRLRYNGTFPKGGSGIATYLNNETYVYIPRYDKNSTHTYDFKKYDVFKVVGYRINECTWRAIEEELTSTKFPSNAKWLDGVGFRDCVYENLSTLDKLRMTRFLNFIKLYTKVYVCKVDDHGGEYHHTGLGSTDSYFFNGIAINLSRYLERKTYGVPASLVTWYENPIQYNSGDDILISLPDMTCTIPIGSSFNDNTFLEKVSHDKSIVYGGDLFVSAARHENLGDGVRHDMGVIGSLNTASNATCNYMAVNFIMKYC